MNSLNWPAPNVWSSIAQLVRALQRSKYQIQSINRKSQSTSYIYWLLLQLVSFKVCILEEKNRIRENDEN